MLNQIEPYKIVIETNRLILREFALDDDKNLYQLNTDKEVMRYTGDFPFLSISEARAFITNYNEYRESGFGRWAVELKESKRFVGWCGFKQHESYVDLGFRFRKNSWGKGYATEAAEACLEFGFKQLALNEVVGRVAKENEASIRVLEKLGMIFWKEDECNGIEDSLYYRILKS